MTVPTDFPERATARQGEDMNFGLDDLLWGAEVHGLESEPDHEVGDLQDLLREAWRLMTPAQRAELVRSRAGLAVLHEAGLVDEYEALDGIREVRGSDNPREIEVE
jgi:hypothetical protein